MNSVLRVSLFSLDQTEALLGGAAVDGGLRRGSGFPLVEFRFRLCPVWAFGSRALDLAGQIWCSLPLFFVALRLWKELWLAVACRAGISVNKAEPSSFFVSVSGRGTGRWLMGFSGVLPWWKTKREVLEASSLNKRSCLLLGVLQVSLLLLAGLGGEGVGGRCLVTAGLGGPVTAAGSAEVFVGGASLRLLLWPAVAARGGAAGAWRRRFGVGSAGGSLLRLGFVRPWWCGERRLEAGVGGGLGRRCTGGKMGGVGDEELWPCPFIASDSVACGGWTLRPSTTRGGSSSPAVSRYGGAGGD